MLSRQSCCCHLGIRLSAASIVLVILLALTIMPARAQGGYDSGSTGADGPFNPTTSQAVQLPPSGIFNFTTINIPAGVTITFIRNANNTPVIMLATGNVTINGTIDISGGNGFFLNGGPGGPGGFAGGRGNSNDGTGLPNALTGDGPGGGGAGIVSSPIVSGGGGGHATSGSNAANASTQNGGLGGPSYGTRTLLPLTGGSGGGGEGPVLNPSGSGGGGGGAILIASSGTITVLNAIISANGGSGSASIDFNSGGGGGGAGGGIRLAANSITGSTTLQASRGAGAGGSGGNGGVGYIRIEAFNLNNFNPSTGGLEVVSTALPQSAILPNAPSLRIASVAGTSAPPAPIGSLQGAPDIVLPASQPNPAAVALEASNLPLGTIVDVILTPERGARTTVQSTPLSGTEANSTATASLTLPNGMMLVGATTVVNLNPNRPKTAANIPPIYIDGERVTRIEVSATYGGASQATYITQSGRRVKN